MEHDYPALLLQAEEVGKPRMRIQPVNDDSDPVFFVPCRVLISYKLELKPGERVLLMVPAGRAGDGSGPADRTRYWFLSGQEGEDWMPKPAPWNEAGIDYDASALDFYGYDAEQQLLPVREKLHGVWRNMADRVEEKSSLPFLPQGRNGRQTKRLLRGEAAFLPGVGLVVTPLLLCSPCGQTRPPA